MAETTSTIDSAPRAAGAGPLMRGVNLHKWYKGVHALKGVSFDLRASEVVGLMGDNGAGKSTLIKILSGAHHQDQGQVLFEGKEVRFSSPRDAMALGIETIYQYTAMVPQMSIARNIFIGREPVRFRIGPLGYLDYPKMGREALQALREVELHLRSPDTPVDELSGGERQGVTIARAMYCKTKIMILDESLPCRLRHSAHRGFRKMLDIEKVDHIGIRVSDKTVSIAFYERLGFRTISDTGFEKGHPIIMQHRSGVVLNLLGPANMPNDKNILMDVDQKYPGITHVSFKVASLDAAKRFLLENGVPLSGQFSFKDLRAVFIRDPDRNVIELDAYAGEEPEARGGDNGPTGYRAHP